MDSVRGFLEILAGGWRASRARMTASFALILLGSVSAPLIPFVLKTITDGALAGDVRTVTLAAVALPVAVIFSQTAGHIAHAIWVELMNLQMIRLGEQLGDLVQGPPGLEHHERADYADRLELMRNEGNPLLQSVRLALFGVALAAQFALTVALLASIEPLLLLLLLFAVPPLLADRWASNREEALRLETADRMRQAQHLFDLAVRQDAAKEVRVFGLQQELARRLGETRNEIRRRFFRVEFTGLAVIAAAQLVFAVGFIGGMLLVVRGAVGGSQSVGDVVLLVTLTAQVNFLVFRIVGITSWLRRSVQAMVRLAWLRDLVRELYPPGQADADVPERLREGIRFEAVGFRYPGTDADVLADVDLDLAAGSTVALVGENGAGKTTLVKLLCGFYAPTDGRITIDGVELARLPVEEWRTRVAAGFQDFVRFELVAQESVGVGDLPLVEDRVAVTAAVDRAAARDVVDRLPDGLETQLGRTYGEGHELSGGQWQKLALARAMMRERPLLLLLDEPTSALDAHAEHALFERYAESAQAVAKATGGIAVFVSHRFSTVRMADLIVVVDGGRIVERGTHAELVALGGIYAELFALQAAAYG